MEAIGAPAAGGAGGGATPPAVGAAGGGAAGGGAPAAGAPAGDAALPDVVPIDSGATGDLLNPQPGAPGMAAGPAGSEPTASAATAGGANAPLDDAIVEQGGTQKISFGGGGGGGDSSSGGGSSHDGGGGTATPQPEPVTAAPPAGPPPEPQPRADAPRDDHAGGRHRPEHDRDEPRILIDPEELVAFARTMGATAADYREIAIRLEAARASGLPPEVAAQVEPRLDTARRALETLADELEADARELELRSGILEELEGTPGVSQSEIAQTVFGMKVTPTLEPPQQERRG